MGDVGTRKENGCVSCQIIANQIWSTYECVSKEHIFHIYNFLQGTR